jgi:hypothetical protein
LPGTYQIETAASECVACDSGMTCVRGMATIDEGHWAWSFMSLKHGDNNVTMDRYVHTLRAVPCVRGRCNGTHFPQHLQFVDHALMIKTSCLH